MKRINANLCPCPCGTNINYQDCCGKWHIGEHYLKAPTAEKLMRSRYSAFVLKLEQYLLDTWHISKKPLSLYLQDDNTKWLGLSIKNYIQHNEYSANVEFIAKSKINGKAQTLQENSTFVFENGIWLYVAGEIQ